MKNIFVRSLNITAASLLLITFTSCFALPVEEPVLPPPVVRGAAAVTYDTAAVSRGDVSLYRDISASYVSAREESPAFTVGDVYIKGIYAEVGDFVRAGDIVAELDREEILRNLEETVQEEARAQLDLKQLDERHALNLKEAGITGTEVDETSYLDERAALLARLEAIRIRMEHLRFEDERRLVRAGMDGTVTYTMSFNEGDMSQADQRVVRISDENQSVFMIRGGDAHLLEAGSRHEMLINREPYEAEVVTAESLGVSRISGEEVYLVITGEEQPQVSARTYATLHLVLAEVKDVLRVNVKAVKKANARTFVYILSGGVRTIRDIEIGLEGNTFTEAAGGLNEGDLVIVD